MWIIGFISFFVVLFGVESQNEADPTFVSISGVHQAMLGQKIILPCEVDNLGDFTVFWSKDGDGGGESLFSEKMRVTTDERFELESKDVNDRRNWALVVNDVEGFDQGVYKCQISTVPDFMTQEQIVSVKVPPSINIVPEKSPYVVEAGSGIKMTCYPSGNPVPTVVWTREGGPLPDGNAEHIGSVLNMDVASRKHEGTYKCTARNGVAPDASSTIKVEVINEGDPKDAPRVTASEDLLHIKVHSSFEVSCSYIANPPPTVDWLHNKFPIDINSAKSTNKYKIQYESKEEGVTISKLRVHDVSKDDFGDYTCRVTNNLGTAEASAHASGAPGPARLNVTKTEQGPLLTWIVQSIEPVTSYLIKYQIIGSNSYQNVQFVPNTDEGVEKDGTYKGSYVLKNLDADKAYEISLMAESKNGLGKPPLKPVIVKISTPGQVLLEAHQDPKGILLSWTVTSEEPVLSYSITIGTTGSKPENYEITPDMQVVGDNGITYTGSYILDTGTLESGNTYEISMLASNRNGWGNAPSNTVSIKTGGQQKSNDKAVKDAGGSSSHPVLNHLLALTSLLLLKLAL